MFRASNETGRKPYFFAFQAVPTKRGMAARNTEYALLWSLGAVAAL